MAAELYVKEVLQSPLHGTPAEVIEEGEFITLNGDGTVSVAETADEIDGIVPHRQRGDVIREHDQDYRTPAYRPEDGDDFVPFYQLVDGVELTDIAIEAGESLDMHEPVDLHADGTVVAAADPDDADAVTLSAAEDGEGVHVRLGL